MSTLFMQGMQAQADARGISLEQMIGQHNAGGTTTSKGSTGIFFAAGGATNPITGQTTAKSADTIALESLQKELSFNRVKQQVTEADQAKLRVEQRKSAIASADFQRRSNALDIQSRDLGLGRQISALNRNTRQVQAQVMSGAAGANNLISSSSQAAQIAARSNLRNEKNYLGKTEGLAQQADAMKNEQISANLSSQLLSLTDPTQVIQDASGQVFVNGKLTTAADQGAGIKGFVSAPTPGITPTPTSTSSLNNGRNPNYTYANVGGNPNYIVSKNGYA